MNVLVTAVDAGSLLTEVRIATPLHAWAASSGGQVRLRDFHACTRADLAWADVLIVQRGIARRHASLIRHMHALGGVVICDIDDLLTDMPPHLSQHHAVDRHCRWVTRCLDAADVVTVSTARLERELGPRACPTFVVPNCACPCSLPIPQAVAGAPCTVLLASSDRAQAGPLLQALQLMQLQRGGMLRVVAVGHAATDATAAGVQVEAHPVLARAAFIALARSLPNVVAAIAVDGSTFAACKSAVKWFDYAEAGVPTLASALSPYADVIVDGISGRLVDADPAAWQAALANALDDAAWRQRVATAARTQARREFSVSQSAQAWRMALDACWARRSPRAASGPLADAWQAVQCRWSALSVHLRRYNRDRLARRKGR